MPEAPAVESTSAAVAPALTGNGVSVSAVTPEPSNGQAATQAQGATGEDNFTQIDPKTLPPELQAVHKSLLGDYTRKTQAIAAREKQLAEASKKAAEYDKLTSSQQFKDTWSEMSRREKADFKEQKAEAEKTLGEKITDEEFAKSFESKDGFLALMKKIADDSRSKDQKEIQELKQKVGTSEAANIIDSVALEVGKDGQPVRPDFYSLDEDGAISGYLRLNATNDPKEFQSKVTEAYNWAKSFTQKHYERGKVDALKIIQTKAQNSSEPPTISSKNAYAGPDPKKLDAAEAVALARKGIRVPQN